MRTGHFLHVDDDTSCGGRILEGYNGWIVDGRPRARAGDKVSCGVDGEVYEIIGGIPFQILAAKLAAGTLDSVSSCPCEATLIPSILHSTYSHGESPAPAPRPTAQATTPIPQPSWRPEAAEAFEQATQADPVANVVAEEPGFYIVPKSTSFEALEADLFEAPSPQVLDKFRSLNPQRGLIKAGALVVLSDPNNSRCTYEETLLLEAAAQASAALADLNAQEADFTADNHGQIQSFLDLSSKAIGMLESGTSKHLNITQGLLKEIERLHVRTFLMHGDLRSGNFFSERKILLSRLNTQLGYLTRQTIGIPNHPKLKRALGLSSRSLVHHWTQAGAPGQIPGYATRLNRVARAGKYIKYGGHLGTGVAAGASYLKVKEVCRAGETEACKRVRITETGAFTGSVIGAELGGKLGAFLAGGLCIALGAPTGGAVTVVCAVVGAGLGNVGGGIIGAGSGELTADVVYEKLK